MTRAITKGMRWAWYLGIPVRRPKIIHTLPHDEAALTQGLLYHDGYLIESTGGYGTSSLRRIRPEDGAVVTLIPVPEVWAEGIGILDKHLVQLTYTEGRALVYTLPDLELHVTQPYRGEGWGLTSDGDQLIMSDGSHRLVWRDIRFNAHRQLGVKIKHRARRRLNDIVFARNKIFANVLWSHYIFQINAFTGTVDCLIDCRELVASVGKDLHNSQMNGIAYNAGTDRFFLTGKGWRQIFEVEF